LFVSGKKYKEGNMKEVLDKILSGRFILTVICGVVFAYASFKKIIPPDAVIAILTTVFVSYFQRNDRKPEEETKKEG
jgi:hypothetical protein